MFITKNSMKIVLYGVETNNKGAELMLYAILQEIERRHPYAKVYIPLSRIKQGLSYVKTTIDLRYWPFDKLIKITHFNGLLKHLGFPIIKQKCFVNSDYFFDGSGFLFSDQTKLWNTTPKWWEDILYNQYKKGAKIVFLPQAFGPFQEEKTQMAMVALNKYATVIMSRERVSYDFIKSSGLVDMSKVKLFTDFTSLVEGVFPESYSYLRDGICIIPNMRMIDSGSISFENYISLLSAIIHEGKKTGRPVYLLNHEGKIDENLAYKCQQSVDGSIDVVTGLNALEVKGLISSAYLVITSRFHGLVSSLNSCVPSLSTSWSHKYEELYHDYKLAGYVLPLNNRDQAILQVEKLLLENENRKIREHLAKQIPLIKSKTKEMWNYIWSL